MTIRVYLAGPVTGCTEAEAHDWRDQVRSKLWQHRIIGVSPLRCEPIHAATEAERYKPHYADVRFGTARAIGAKNRFDCRSCDMGLFYLPKVPEERRHQSYGTIGELFWANAYGRQTVLVSDDEEIMSHPVIDTAASWKLGTLEQAVDVIVGVLGIYTA